jgi:hypothetical protein
MPTGDQRIKCNLKASILSQIMEEITDKLGSKIFKIIKLVENLHFDFILCSGQLVNSQIIIILYY